MGQGIEAITDAAGTYQITGVFPGQVTVHTAANDYLVSAATFAATGRGVFILSPRLTPLSALQSSIEGTIMDAVTDLPLENVLVSISGTVVDTASTDASGGYRIENIPGGEISILVSLAGYQTVSANVTVGVNNRLIFSPGLTPIEPGITRLIGTVTDATTGAPLPGAQVNVTGSTSATLFTDANGAYSLSPLNTGDIEVTVTLDGYQGVVGTTTVVENTTLDFSPPLQPIVVQTDSDLSGIVVDAVTSLPLSNVMVEIIANGQTIQTMTGVNGPV